MNKKLIEITSKKSSSLKLSDVASTGLYPVYGASGICGYCNNYQVDEECVGIVKDGAGIGRVHLISPKSSVLSTLQIIIPNDEINSKYLYYLVKHMNLGSTFNGATIPHIYYKNYSLKNVKVYEKSRQEEIVNLLSGLEKQLINKEQQLDSLNEIIKSRFIEMFETIDLSEQRSNWKELGTVSKIYTGTTPSTKEPKNWDGDVLWITPAEMNKETFYVYDTERKITELGRKSKSLDLMPVNTVLLSTRAPIGKVGIVGKPMACNQGFKNFECSKDVNPVFLYILLKNNTEYLNSLGSGTTFLEVSKSRISKMLIPVPPIDLQNEFESFVKLIDKSKFIVQQQINDLQELLDKKMDEYFGE